MEALPELIAGNFLSRAVLLGLLGLITGIFIGAFIRRRKKSARGGD